MVQCYTCINSVLSWLWIMFVILMRIYSTCQNVNPPSTWAHNSFISVSSELMLMWRCDDDTVLTDLCCSLLHIFGWVFQGLILFLHFGSLCFGVVIIIRCFLWIEGGNTVMLVWLAVFSVLWVTRQNRFSVKTSGLHQDFKPWKHT